MNHFRIEEAIRGRRCHACSRPIDAEEKCLTFRLVAGGSSVVKNACLDCLEKLYMEANSLEHS